MSVARGFPNAGHFYSNLVKPIKIDCNFIVDATNGNGLGVRSIKSNGYVRNVFMHTSATPGMGEGLVNPNPAVGYALIQMKQNFNAYLGGFTGFVSPLSGSAIHVASSSVLTAGVPYVITNVGAAIAPSFTVVAVADSAGSLAGRYFLASDQSSNNYLFYFVVSGVGSPPALVGALANYVAVPVAIATNAANTVVGAAIATSMGAVNNASSWTAVNSGHTVTVTGAFTTVSFSPLPQDVNSGVTVSGVTYTSLMAGWQSVGVPAGLTPAVGLAFIATATGSAVLSSAATVQTSGVSGITSIEVIGNANASINNQDIAANGGAWLLVQFLSASSTAVTSTLTMNSYTPAGTNANDGPPETFTGTPAVLTGTIVNSGGVTSLAPAAPAAGSVVGMSFCFDGSSVTIDGL